MNLFCFNIIDIVHAEIFLILFTYSIFMRFCIFPTINFLKVILLPSEFVETLFCRILSW